jgi:AcrR family transcriptional regulator
MAGQKASGQRRLTRDDWIAAALAAIADGGLAAVGVEPLAARLGATKGSFYWHFENRDALLEAAIRRWEKETTTDVVAEITAARDAPASQFRRLVAGVIERAEQDRVGPALLASATHPAVAPALQRITAVRLSLITTVLRRLGLPPAEARRRALLAYSAYLGHGQLAHSTPAVLPATRAGRRAYLDDAIRALTTP